MFYFGFEYSTLAYNKNLVIYNGRRIYHSDRPFKKYFKIPKDRRWDYDGAKVTPVNNWGRIWF